MMFTVAPRSGARYVAVGDSDVTYQVVGSGQIDVLFFYGLGSHVELLTTVPAFEEFNRDLTSFSRVMYLDRRGTGTSDSVLRTAMPTVEEWTEDVQAVLDTAGSRTTGDHRGAGRRPCTR